MKYRHRVLGFLCLLAAITYLDRVAISVAGPRIQESLSISPEMWGWVVGIFTVSYAIFVSHWTHGRPHRRTPCLDPHCVVVVGVHRLYRHDFELLCTLDNSLLFWRRRGRRTAEHCCQPLTMVSGYRAGSRDGCHIHVHASRWRACTADHSADTGSLWLARFVLCMGVIGVVWSLAWYLVVSRLPPSKRKCEQSEMEEIGVHSFADNHSLPWSVALRSTNLWAILALAFCYVFSLYFFISWLIRFW